MPKICFATRSASPGLFASFTPPPLPRPPAWICAFTTTVPPPRRSATPRAPAALNTASPDGTSNPLVVPVEIGLLIVFLIHLFKAVRMTMQNRAARPAPYAVKKMAGGASQKSLASSTMIVTGLALLVFIPIHVKMFKYGPEYPYGIAGMRDLYRVELEN